ncbi:MAG: hypothetical protein QM500_13135 [Methylococcales bacterium]
MNVSNQQTNPVKNSAVTHVSGSNIEAAFNPNVLIDSVTGEHIPVTDPFVLKHMVKLGEFRDEEFNPHTVPAYLHKIILQEISIGEAEYRIGILLNEAEVELEPHEYKELVKIYERCDRTIHRYKTVAACPMIKKYINKIPAPYSTRYLITKMDEKFLTECIKKKLITKTTKRLDVEKLLKANGFIGITQSSAVSLPTAFTIKASIDTGDTELAKVKYHLNKIKAILGKDGEIEDLFTKKIEAKKRKELAVKRKEQKPDVKKQLQKVLKHLKSKAEHKPVAKFYEKYGEMEVLRAMDVNMLFEYLGSSIRYPAFDGYTIKNKKVK